MESILDSKNRVYLANHIRGAKPDGLLPIISATIQNVIDQKRCMRINGISTETGEENYWLTDKMLKEE